MTCVFTVCVFTVCVCCIFDAENYLDMRNYDSVSLMYITCQVSGLSCCVLFCSCRSLVDTVYSLKDEVQELKQVSLWFTLLLTCNVSAVFLKH